MKKYRSYLSILLITITCFITSCNDFLTQVSESNVSNTNFWKTENDCESALNGLQEQFRYTFSNVNILNRNRGFVFDYMTNSWAQNCNNTPTWSSVSPTLQWANEYTTIANANLIIDNIFRANISSERYNFYLGQALCIRAHTYFYIARTWGSAPLIRDSEDVGERARTHWRVIVNHSEADYLQAIDLLPHVSDLKDANGNHITSKQYWGKETAQAQLADLYAYVAGFNNEPELLSKGLKMADAVINSGEYQLVDNPKEVCETVMRGNSKEGILELNFDRRYNEIRSTGSCIQGACQKWPVEPLTVPSTARTKLRILFSTVDKIFPDPNDLRRKEYFYKLDSTSQFPSSVSQNSAYIWKWRGVVKYVGGYQDGKIKGYDDNEILQRLAGLFLLRAEMRAKTGDYAGAQNDLNKVRNRAGLKDYSPNDGELLEAIAQEMERELFAEGNIRMFDNFRNHTYRQNLKGEFKNLTEQDVLDGALFIQVSEYAFFNNPLMEQTTYWKYHGNN